MQQRWHRRLLAAADYATVRIRASFLELGLRAIVQHRVWRNDDDRDREDTSGSSPELAFDEHGSRCSSELGADVTAEPRLAETGNVGALSCLECSYELVAVGRAPTCPSYGSSLWLAPWRPFPRWGADEV